MPALLGLLIALQTPAPDPALEAAARALGGTWRALPTKTVPATDADYQSRCRALENQVMALARAPAPADVANARLADGFILVRSPGVLPPNFRLIPSTGLSTMHAGDVVMAPVNLKTGVVTLREISGAQVQLTLASEGPYLLAVTNIQGAEQLYVKCSNT
jgi:hypothetical protein